MLVEDRSVAEYFEQVIGVDGVDAKGAANWMTGEFFRRLKETDAADITAIRVRPQQLGQLLKLVTDSTISGSAAKDVFGVMWESGGEPDKIVEEKGLKQISDSSELESAVEAVIAEQSEAADKVRGGDEKPIQFLMGQVMRATKGKANPQLVQQLLRERLS